MPEQASGGAFEVAVELSLDEAETARFYDLYRRAFGPLATRAVARQVLHAEEFAEEMRDERVLKLVVREPSGEAVGLSTLTRDLHTVPWISPDYFAAHYPEHTARNAVFYLGFTLVAPHQRRAGIFRAMIDDAVQRIVAERGVCGYDICAYNEETLGFSASIQAIVEDAVVGTVGPVDAQTYYVADMHRPRVRG